MQKQLSFLFVFVFLCATSAFAFKPPADEFIIGTNIHYYWGECMIDDTLGMMQQANFNSFRLGYSWARALDKKDDGSAKPFPRAHESAVRAKDYGIVPLLLMTGRYDTWPVTPPTYAYYENFCKSMVRAGKDVGGFFQIWNEWDGGHMMKDKSRQNTVENYINVIKGIYPALKAISPETPVLSNSFCTGEPAVFKVLELGLQKYCDAYCVHTYAPQSKPEDVYPQLMRYHNKAAECAKKDGVAQKPFYITEMGWYQSIGTVNEETQGDYCARFYLLASIVPTCKGVYWYNFNDRGSNYKDGSDFWGMTMRDATPKQSYYALASVAKVIRKGKFVRRIDVGNPNYWILEYRMPDGTYALAAWTINENERLQIVLEQKDATKRTPFFMERCGNHSIKRLWGFRDHDLAVKDKKTTETAEAFSFHTTTRPVLIMGLKDGFSIASATPYVMHQKTREVPITPTAFGYVHEKGTVFDLSSDAQYRIIRGGANRSGKNDISATMKIGFTQTHLELTFEVTDDVFSVINNSSAYWNGDSIQLTFAPLQRGGDYTDGSDYVDIMLVGNTQKGNLCLERTCNSDYAPSATASFTFSKSEKNPKVSIYHLTIPLATIGLDRKTMCSGMPFGFTAIINDNDGAGRKGWLFWGQGIGGNRSSSLNGWLVFKD